MACCRTAQSLVSVCYQKHKNQYNKNYSFVSCWLWLAKCVCHMEGKNGLRLSENRVFPFMSGSSRWSLTFRFCHWNSTCISCFPFVPHAPPISDTRVTCCTKVQSLRTNISFSPFERLLWFLLFGWPFGLSAARSLQPVKMYSHAKQRQALSFCNTAPKYL